jgi:hypothetical protein
MADDTQNMQGVSNPPNGGNITDVANPEANDATVSQTAVASQQQPPQSPADKGPQTPTPQAPQAAQAPGQPQDQSNGPQGKQPDLSKGQQPVPAAAPAPTQNPVTAKASMFHDIAETLAGGPRYKYDVDAYGNTTKQKVPVSGQHLALALAMEALTGGITGLANGQGPNGIAKGTAAAMAQSNQKVQDQDEQAKKQAQDDFARRAQVTETNMRLYANARNIGRMDAEDTDKYLSQYKPTIDQIQQEYPGMVKGIVKYADLGKYNATADTAIPYARVPRLDQNGQQATDPSGVPQWDMDYMVLDPKFTAQFEPTDEERKNYKEMTGQDLPPMTGNTAMNAGLWMNKKSQLAGWGVAKTNFKDFETTLNKAEEEQGGRTSTADLTQEGALKAPPIKNAQIQSLADSTATAIAPQVKTVVTPDNFQALIHGIIHQESGGDANAVSPTGATGVMQLTQATAKQMGVTDRTNAEQNIKGGTQYFAQLLNQYKDPKLALAAYYSGPGAIQNGKIVDTQLHTAADTNNYAQSIANNIGLQAVAPVKEGDQFKLPDIGQFSQAHPTFPSAVEKFNASLGHTDGSFGAALKDMESKGFGKDSALIQNYLGSAQNIKNHDDYMQTQAEVRKAQVATDAQEERAANKAAQSAQADAKAYDDRQEKIGTLINADVPKDSLNMSDKDLTANLAKQGVTLPPSVLIDAKAIGRYEAPLSSVSNKKWYKDHGVTQDEMVSIVRQLNPSYSEPLYTNLKKFQDPNSADMKTITASAGVANHLNMLLDAAEEAKNGGSGVAGQFPAMNKLANAFNYQMGGNTYSNLSALTNAVNGEMGKVLSGGFAPDKAEIEALMKNMNPNNSYQQIHSLAKLYTGVMHGKVAPLDEEYSQGTGGVAHLRMIPKSSDRLYQRMGYETPWDTEHASQSGTGGGQQAFAPKPGNANQYKQLSRDGKLGIGTDGKKYVVATGQLAQ